MALQQFWKSFTSKPHKLLLNPPTHCFNLSLVGTVPFTIYYLLLTAIILSLSCVAFDDKISSFWGMPHKRVSSFLSTMMRFCLNDNHKVGRRIESTCQNKYPQAPTSSDAGAHQHSPNEWPNRILSFTKKKINHPVRQHQPHTNFVYVWLRRVYNLGDRDLFPHSV